MCVVRRVLEELLETELLYVADLKLVVEVRAANMHTHTCTYTCMYIHALYVSTHIHAQSYVYVPLPPLLQKCRPRFVSELLPHTLKGKEETVFSNIADVESFHKRYIYRHFVSW